MQKSCACPGENLLPLLDKGLCLIETEKNLESDPAWLNIKQALKEQAQQEQQLVTLRPYLEKALKSVGLSGVYLEPTPLGKKMSFPKPIAHILDRNVAYLYLPNTEVPSLQNKIFYQSLEPLIKRFAHRRLSGWIIDLRDSAGYDVSGLLKAMSLLFAPSDKKLFLVKDNEKEELLLPITARLFIKTDMPVALLQGPNTRLSGECLLAALSTRPNTKTFGQSTSGTPYVLRLHELAPGYSLLFENGFLSLNEKKGPLAPQTPVKENEPNKDQTLFQALEWIESVNRPEDSPAQNPS